MGEDSSSKNKSLFLGVPFGTACHRLRKALLFSFAIRLNMGKCFRCGGEIDSLDEFSIDHKMSWEGVSSELFWDLDNIAFSHLSCNVGAPSRKVRSRKPYGECVEGYAWCSVHQERHPVAEFSKNASTGNGLQLSCKVACNEEHAKRAGNPTSHGTQAGYRTGCRCKQCKSAYSAARKKRYENSKS